jgi:hypothetical protein
VGWISKRHMQNGGSIGGNPAKTRETNRYPLRNIVQVIRWSETIFGPNFVEFDCGHSGSAWGASRGRCRDCPPRK